MLHHRYYLVCVTAINDLAKVAYICVFRNVAAVWILSLDSLNDLYLLFEVRIISVILVVGVVVHSLQLEHRYGRLDLEDRRCNWHRVRYCFGACSVLVAT